MMNKKIPFAFYILILSVSLYILFIFGKRMLNDSQVDMNEQNDYLIYVLNGHSGEGKLMFYDPDTNIHTPILPSWGIGHISISENNLLAFSSSHEGNSEIYILDYPFTENEPVNISRDAHVKNDLFSWSLDGHYLAFESIQDDGKTLLIWDGKTISPIHNYQEQIGEIAWSLDNRLAFTEFYFSHEGDSSEIYIWDGNTTTSLSQNPSGEDRHPAWSEDGQLAFVSARKGEYDVFIWDGVSKINSLPDVNTFTNIVPDLTAYFSYPAWTSSGSLAFSGLGDKHVQIYEWDGKSASNISQNPDSHNGGPRWSHDGHWAFITFFSSEQNIYIRDEENKTIATTTGQYVPAWSHNGYLTFCVPTPERDWTLAIWNRTEVIKIIQNKSNISASWRNGESVHCSN